MRYYSYPASCAKNVWGVIFGDAIGNFGCSAFPQSTPGTIPNNPPGVGSAACKAQCANTCGVNSALDALNPATWGCQSAKASCNCGGSAFNQCLPGVPIPCIWLIGGGAFLMLLIALKKR